MGEIVISHTSALIFWRCFTGRVSSLRRSRSTTACEEHITLTPALLDELAQLGFRPSPQAPLDLLFANRSARVFQPEVRPHIESSALPRGSFLRLSEHVLIVRPELCLIQIAGSLSIERLIMMCCEFCGVYPPFPKDSQCTERPQLTSLADLNAYATAALPPRSGQQFRRALRYTMEGAASPMEAKVALMMSLPYSLGGYGLPTPVLNYPHSLSEEAFKIYSCSPCRLDICWPNARIDVEYDGGIHETPRQHARDVARLNALALDGYHVTVISYAQARDSSAFDAIVRKVASRVGYRIQIRVEDFPARRRKLREEFDLV